MANKAYVKGRKKEYKIVNSARGKGLIAHRTAGSHGDFDVIVIDKFKRIITFVQSKTYNVGESQRKRINEECAYLNGPYMCEFMID